MVRSAKDQAGIRSRRRGDEAEPKETGALIKRWIGATRRRTIRQAHEDALDRADASAGEGAQIITLTWAQTFGRPATTASKQPAPGDGSPRSGQTVILRPRSCA